MAELVHDSNLKVPDTAVKFVLPIDLETLQITSPHATHLLDVATLMEACFQRHPNEEIAEEGRRAEQRLFGTTGLAMLPSTAQFVNQVTGASSSDSIEQGLFAFGRSFKVNSTVAQAYGCIIHKKHITKDQLRYAVEVDSDNYLVAPYRSFFALANHSTTPNAIFRSSTKNPTRISIQARTSIDFGQEITVDYYIG